MKNETSKDRKKRPSENLRDLYFLGYFETRVEKIGENDGWGDGKLIRVRLTTLKTLTGYTQHRLSDFILMFYTVYSGPSF